MISITLTGEEATKYLSHIDAIDAAYDTIAELQAEIHRLRLIASKHERAIPQYEQKYTPPDLATPLMKHLAEQKAKQESLESPFSAQPQRTVAILQSQNPPKWTDADVRQLQSFPDGPPSKRTLEHVCKVFPDRTENAIRNKLNSLGIRVKAGTLVWKK